MPFRAMFDCLWCGRPWQTRTSSDLEGWAALCSECLGRAGDNAFLGFRLRTGLADRARAADAGSGAPPGPSGASAPGHASRGMEALEPAAPAVPGSASVPDPSAPELEANVRTWFSAIGPAWDDLYLRRGRYSRGPVRDIAWEMELDAVTGWLDRLPLRGEIVELAAGTGWWSPLLAGKGELSLYDVNETVLDVARSRLVAHRLRAHLHVHDAWAEPDRRVDAVFAGFWLSLLPDGRLVPFLELVGRWLRPGGVFAFVDRKGDPETDAVDDPAPDGGLARRRLLDGREVLIPQVVRDRDQLGRALRETGFTSAEVTETGRFFVMGAARR